LFTVLILLLCVTVPAVVLGAAVPFIAPELIRMVLIASALGLGMITLVTCGFELCRKWLIPHSLRKIGRFPFFLHAERKAAA
jgi:hypothetical protein